MKLREGSVFTGVFHSVWGSYVATTHDALDFSEPAPDMGPHCTETFQDRDLTLQGPPVQW